MERYGGTSPLFLIGEGKKKSQGEGKPLFTNSPPLLSREGKRGGRFVG